MTEVEAREETLKRLQIVAENEVAIKMNYIGLLTPQQKQAGYFVSQTEDFVFLWRSRPHVDCVAVFLYDNCTIKQVREACDLDIRRTK